VDEVTDENSFERLDDAAGVQYRYRYSSSIATVPAPSTAVGELAAPTAADVTATAPNAAKNTFSLLTDCPVPSCLASFPDDYRGLRAHLANEHFAADMTAALMRLFDCLIDDQFLSEPCRICPVHDDESNMLSHYALCHGHLDRRLWTFFTERLQPFDLNRCLKAGCQFAARDVSEYVK
jgi:hypothetical protein